MNHKKGLVFIFLTAVISGFSVFVNKFGVSGINPYIFTFLKNFAVLAFVFGGFVFLKEFSLIKKLTKKQWLNLSLIGLLGGSIPFLLFFKGLSITSAVNAAFMHKTMFIYIALFALIFLKEKISKKWLIGAILLLTGNILLLKLRSFSFNIGDLMILTATLFWAVENTISKHALKELSSRIVIFGRFFFGSLFILIFFGLTGGFKEFAVLNSSSMLWIILTSVFLLLYVLTWYSGLKHVDVSKAACILLLGAPITTVLTYIYFGAAITLSQSIGMLLIVAGIMFAVGFSNINILLSNPSKSNS